MSTALQLPLPWAPRAGQTGRVNLAASAALQPQLFATAIHHIQRLLPKPELLPDVEPASKLLADSLSESCPEILENPLLESPSLEDPLEEPLSTWAFYRKHTESLLRRYLYASMQVGRSPNLLGESVGRGWVSSRRVKTFEDALIFVLDVERCLSKLDLLDRQLITRRILQEYTHQEAAALLGISLTTVNVKLPQALDHLTEALVNNDLLVLPD